MKTRIVIEVVRPMEPHAKYEVYLQNDKNKVEGTVYVLPTEQMATNTALLLQNWYTSTPDIIKLFNA